MLLIFLSILSLYSFFILRPHPRNVLSLSLIWLAPHSENSWSKFQFSANFAKFEFAKFLAKTSKGLLRKSRVLRPVFICEVASPNYCHSDPRTNIKEGAGYRGCVSEVFWLKKCIIYLIIDFKKCINIIDIKNYFLDEFKRGIY